MIDVYFQLITEQEQDNDNQQERQEHVLSVSMCFTRSKTINCDT